MDWKHKCSLDWLRARQHHITASDVKSLLPFTRTGRPRTVGDEEMLKVMASKMIKLTEEDCWSYGAMARGHLMEPYAVKALNKMLRELHADEADQLYWWDDELVEVSGRSLAFSPDGLDVEMGDDPTMAKVIVEVKSYSPSQHLVTAYTPKDRLEERWQIASAMALLPSIERGYLVLFNPSMKWRKTFVITFERSELEREIEEVLKVEERWDDWREHGPLVTGLPNGGVWSAAGGTEEEIRKEVMAEQGVLNP